LCANIIKFIDKRTKETKKIHVLMFICPKNKYLCSELQIKRNKEYEKECIVYVTGSSTDADQLRLKERTGELPDRE
jgi:hypothetical protein